MKLVKLAKGREVSIQRFHPWIFSGAVKQMDESIEEGDVVHVTDYQDKFLGIGLYQNGSICVRIISFQDIPMDDSFWDRAMSRAVILRKQFGLPKPGFTDAFRLIHGEGDFLPGLIIDIYHDTAVIQCHNTGMHRFRHQIAAALTKAVPFIKSVYNKSADTLPKRFSSEEAAGFLIGQNDGLAYMREHGHQFQIDFVQGQKTGFFLDQRDNRYLLGSVSKNKKVLNAFCYTGGFTMYAINGGAMEVHSLDASSKALSILENNIKLNGFGKTNHTTIQADAMEYLQQPQTKYDIIVLDPPAFAKTLAKRHAAVNGYKRLNAMAMRQMKPGNLLFTFSCSQVVGPALFEDTIRAAALESGNMFRIVSRMQQGLDHPVSLHHPEGNYLKGLVLECV